MRLDFLNCCDVVFTDLFVCVSMGWQTDTLKGRIVRSLSPSLPLVQSNRRSGMMQDEDNELILIVDMRT